MFSCYYVKITYHMGFVRIMVVQVLLCRIMINVILVWGLQCSSPL
ncbi:putative membrane protein [Anaplasma phagocytophilum str. Annie]|nr:putative membrane protein [Anaplasma phagocytophilum str. Annie]